MKFIKNFILGVFLFFFFYFDTIYLGPLKWAQLWKGIYIIIMMSFWIKQTKIKLKMFKVYFLLPLFYMATPFFFQNFSHILIRTFEYLFFPSTFLFIIYITKLNKNYISSILEFISIFFIISFIPFYLKVLPELGKTYDLEALGIGDQSGITGLFQQPHASSQILAYSCISLFYLILKTNKKSTKIILKLFLPISLRN